MGCHKGYDQGFCRIARRATVKVTARVPVREAEYVSGELESIPPS